MHFAASRQLFRTLRFRLTLWNTAVVLILVIANLVAVLEGLRLVRARMVDEFITEELEIASEKVLRLADNPTALHGQLDREATGHPRRALFIQILDTHGEPEWSSAQTPERSLPAGKGADNTLIQDGDYRYAHRHLSLSGREVVVRVGISMQRAEMEMARFTEILIWAGALVALLAPLGGYLLAARATRPVAHIIQTAAKLHPANLNERLRVRGTFDELDQLSLTINSLLDRIAGYLERNREFTANAAHELRSPLAAIQGMLELALNADRSVEAYQELIADVLEECGKLRVLINQLLLLAEGDAGRLCPAREAVRLDQTVQRSLEMFQVVAETAEVNLRTGRLDPVTVLGDDSCLWQVVNNLVDNAIKFTPPGGTVTVSLTRGGTDGQAVLTVADTGTGVAPEDLPHLFERFYQGDKARPRRDHKRGTGLGLSICQAIVEAHQGCIEVVSPPGQGTTFTVRLPGLRLNEPEA